MAILATLLTRLSGGGESMTWFLWFTGCSISLALPLLAAAIAVRSFRSMANPLADLMAAADSVAQGNLDVRVSSNHAPADFRQLAESFNLMVNELQRADQQRRNLTADVAHELRTPLQVIQGNLEGILDGVYQPNTDHIESTLEESRRLARLVEDLQTLSLAESGVLNLRKEEVNITEMLKDIQTSFSGQAEASGIMLQVITGEGLTAILDIDRIHQVLSNLVSNAIRHTPQGGEISLLAQSIDGGIRIQVVDNGQGIAANELPYLFDRFWRGDRSRTHSTGAGSGLGLAIAKQLIEAHSGTIIVESQPGFGSVFTINLPLADSIS